MFDFFIAFIFVFYTLITDYLYSDLDKSTVLNKVVILSSGVLEEPHFDHKIKIMMNLHKMGMFEYIKTLYGIFGGEKINVNFYGPTISLVLIEIILRKNTNYGSKCKVFLTVSFIVTIFSTSIMYLGNKTITTLVLNQINQFLVLDITLKVLFSIHVRIRLYPFMFWVLHLNEYILFFIIIGKFNVVLIIVSIILNIIYTIGQNHDATGTCGKFYRLYGKNTKLLFSYKMSIWYLSLFYLTEINGIPFIENIIYWTQTDIFKTQILGMIFLIVDNFGTRIQKMIR